MGKESLFSHPPRRKRIFRGILAGSILIASSLGAYEGGYAIVQGLHHAYDARLHAVSVSREAEIRRLNTETRMLREQLTEREAELRDARKDLSLYKKEIQTYQTQLQTLEERLMQTREDERPGLREDLAWNGSSRKREDTSHGAWKNRRIRAYAETRQTIKSSRQSSLSSEAYAFNEVSYQLYQQTRLSAREISLLKKNTAQLEERLTNEKALREKGDRVRMSLSKELSYVKKQLTEKTTAYTRLAEKYHALERTYGKLRKAYDMERAQHVQDEQQIRLLREKNQNLERSIEGLRSRLRETEDSMIKTEKLEERLRNIEQENASLIEENKRLKNMLTEYAEITSTYTMLKEDYAALKETVNKLQSENAWLKWDAKTLNTYIQEECWKEPRLKGDPLQIQ